MKTSLIIEDKVFKDAKKESAQSGQSVSMIISQWAALGRTAWKKRKQQKKALSPFKPVNLGKQKLNLSSRDIWLDTIDDST